MSTSTTPRLDELLQINHASIEAHLTDQRLLKTVPVYPYKMRVSDAKRFVGDAIGYEIVREFLCDGSLVNRHFTSRLQEGVEFITVGQRTLVVDHAQRSLHIQE